MERRNQKIVLIRTGVWEGEKRVRNFRGNVAKNSNQINDITNDKDQGNVVKQDEINTFVENLNDNNVFFKPIRKSQNYTSNGEKAMDTNTVIYPETLNKKKKKGLIFLLIKFYNFCKWV